MASRDILLRRPAVVQVTGDHWRPEPALCDAAERRWALMCRHNPHLFDGEILQVIGVHRNGHGGAVLHVRPCAFRWYAVQTDGPDCGCRPLGVKGVVRRGTQLLMGRRAAWTTFHAGAWEFAPSGGVQSGDSPESAILKELHEETGLSTSTVPQALAVCFDDQATSWEVMFDLGEATGEAACTTGEYDDMHWADPADLPTPPTPMARRMLALLS